MHQCSDKVASRRESISLGFAALKKRNNITRSPHFILTLVVALSLSLPTPGQAYTVLKSVKIGGQGTLTESSSMAVQLIGGSEITGQTGNGQFVISYPQYLKVNFSANRAGFQAVIISTANKEPTANPKYTGGGSGSGLVQTSNTSKNVALHWVVQAQPVTGGYTFTSCGNEPICTSNQFFVADKSESPFPAGYASTLYDINSASGQLPGAPTAGRSVSNGEFYIYLGANFKGSPTGTYKSSTLRVELVTIHGDGSTSVHHSYQTNVTGIR